jgi:hypothetical protein
VALGVSQATAGTMEFEPVQVASISGQTGGTVDPRVLLAFDLSALPQDAVVLHAEMRLTDQAAIAWSCPFVAVLAGALTKQWDASTTSWENASGNQAWDDPGGDWDPEPIAYRVLVRKARVPSELVLTEIVSKWASGAIPNYGLIVMMPEAEDFSLAVPYFNAQYLTPVLTIRYFVPE